MSDINESRLQAAIDELRNSAQRFFNAAQSVQSRAQYLFAISLNITYSASDWAGEASQTFQNTWSQFDFDSHKAVDALNNTGNALDRLAQKLDDSLQEKRRAEALQAGMLIATIGLGILDVAQLGLDPATDAATVGVGAAAVGADAVDLGAMVADADIAAESELAGIETADIGALDTLDAGALDIGPGGDMIEGSGIPGISSEDPGMFDESGLDQPLPDGAGELSSPGLNSVDEGGDNPLPEGPGEPDNPDGEGGGGSNSGPNDEQSQRIQNTIDKERSIPNKEDHIFDNPTHDHQWDVTGLDRAGNWNLIKTTLENNGDLIPLENGNYEVTEVFGNYSVTVRGTVIDGIIRIGTAWVNP